MINRKIIRAFNQLTKHRDFSIKSMSCFQIQKADKIKIFYDYCFFVAKILEKLLTKNFQIIQEHSKNIPQRIDHRE